MGFHMCVAVIPTDVRGDAAIGPDHWRSKGLVFSEELGDVDDLEVTSRGDAVEQANYSEDECYCSHDMLMCLGIHLIEGDIFRWQFFCVV